MNRPVLIYNKNLDQMSRQGLKLAPGPVSLSDPDLIEFALQEYRSSTDDPPDGFNWSEHLFYLLMQVGRKRPGLFPTPDLCLTFFNLLNARHSLEASRLVCLDFSLLPVALLAAGRGAKVGLPPISGYKSWPDWLFPTARVQDRSLSGALVLGRDPLALTQEDPELPQKMVQASGGLFFCFWDFLGVNLHHKIRKQWLEAGILRSVIQLPRPRFQTVVYYPAVIETGPVPTDRIRLVTVKESQRGPGSLPQAEVLRGILEPPDGLGSIDLPPENLVRGESSDFTPRRYLAMPSDPNLMTLGKWAKLLRFQLRRVKLAQDEGEGESALAGDGPIICREISFPNLDERSGFLPPKAGNWVKILPQGQKFKDVYLLRPGDILMSFRGTEATIGRVGLVDSAPKDRSITSQNLCIIRPEGKSLDPLWLYYYLRRVETRQQVLGFCSGTQMLTINMGDLVNLPIPYPEKRQEENCRSGHAKMRDKMNKLWLDQFDVEELMRDLVDKCRNPVAVLANDDLQTGEAAPEDEFLED